MKVKLLAALLISIGILLMALEALPHFQNAVGGAVIFIGPIPIVIGFGAPFELLLLLLIIAIIGFILLIKAIS